MFDARWPMKGLLDWQSPRCATSHVGLTCLRRFPPASRALARAERNVMRQGKQLKFDRLYCCYFTVMFLLTAITAVEGCQAREAFGEVRVLKTFALGKGDAVLCYDQEPAFLFASTESDGPNSVRLFSLDGGQREIARITGKIVPSSLSCSDDGKVVAFVGGNAAKANLSLFIVRDGATSEYRLDRWSSKYPIEGTHSLLSEDGQAIALPSSPVHVSGPDVLRNMKLFVYADGKTFFSGELLIHDQEELVEALSFQNGSWDRKFAIAKESGTFIREAGRCADRTIALFAENESDKPGQIYDISSGRLEKPAWFSGSNFSKKTREHGSGITPGSNFNHCVYAVQRWASTHFDLQAVVVFDSAGVGFFVPKGPTVGNQGATLAQHQISIAKDGCHLLASTYIRQPRSYEELESEGVQVILAHLRSNSKSCQ